MRRSIVKYSRRGRYPPCHGLVDLSRVTEECKKGEEISEERRAFLMTKFGRE